MTKKTFRIVVAIPARDEAELLPLCLEAIARQQNIDMSDLAVVASCNNCSDDSAAKARDLTSSLPFRLQVDEVTLPGSVAHAGGARRRAMDVATELCAEDGVVVTTDADGVADADWLAAYVAAFENGVDAVAGRVSTDWEELKRFPPDVLEVGAQEWEYQGLCAELEARCDPELHDPWPRHNQTCGANLAVTRRAYRAVGGLPVLRTGEDGALVREVWRRDGRVRHDPGPHVTVSARLVGRAQGGMADALSLRHGDDYLCDDLLEPADDLVRRATWRHAAREAFHQGALASWLHAAAIAPATAEEASTQRYFGEAWLAIEAGTPVLAKRRLSAEDLAGERRRVEAHLRGLRAAQPSQAECAVR